MFPMYDYDYAVCCMRVFYKIDDIPASVVARAAFGCAGVRHLNHTIMEGNVHTQAYVCAHENACVGAHSAHKDPCICLRL